MTTDEAIRRINDHIAVHHIGEYPHVKLRKALNIAISALRTQQQAEKFNPPCYQPDGDGCAYQTYGDNNDEPIDRCKECPLCYSDKTRHQRSADNDPLTLEELREMDGEPVWVNGTVFNIDRSCGGLWAIVFFEQDEVVFGDRDSLPLKDIVGFAYRHKPEED